MAPTSSRGPAQTFGARLRDYAREPFRPRDRSTAEGRAEERHRRIALTSVASAAARCIGIAVSFVSIPLAVAHLGTERFGVWATLGSFTALTTFVDLGMGNSLIGALAAADATSNRAAARRYVSTAAVVLSGVAVVLAAAFAALYAFVPWGDVFNVSSPTALREVGPATAVFVASLVIALPLGIVQRIQIAYQEGFATSAWTAGGSVMSLGALLLVIHFDLGLPYVVAALAGTPLVTTVGNGVAMFARRYRWLRPSLSDASASTARAVLRTGLLFVALQAAGAVAFETDNVVIAQVLGADQVTQYAVPYRLFAAGGLLLSFVLVPLWPAYSEAIARDDRAWVRRTLARSIKLGLLLNVPISLALLFAGQSILHWWVGGAIKPPTSLLAVLAVWLTLNGVSGPIAMFLNGVGVVGFQMMSAAAMAAANLALSIVLAREYGIVGPVAGSVIAQALFVVIPSLLYVRRRLRDLEVGSLSP